MNERIRRMEREMERLREELQAYRDRRLPAVPEECRNDEEQGWHDAMSRSRSTKELYSEAHRNERRGKR